MGRGLSKLQHLILQLGYENRSQSDPTHPAYAADVTHGMILYEYYGWPLMGSGAARARSHYLGCKFDRQAIGSKAYSAGQAAVTRAIRRLEQRGLVTSVPRGSRGHGFAGANLTDAGMKLARSLIFPKRER